MKRGIKNLLFQKHDNRELKKRLKKELYGNVIHYVGLLNLSVNCKSDKEKKDIEKLQKTIEAKIKDKKEIFDKMR